MGTEAHASKGLTHHLPLSRRMMDDEPELLNLIADILALGDEVTRAIRLPNGWGQPSKPPSETLECGTVPGVLIARAASD